MIRDSGARISIMATGALMPPIKQAGYMTATRSPQPSLTLARGRGPYMTQGQNPRAKCRPRHFAISFFSLGAGVTPAQGSVKPTAGFTFD